MTGTPDSSPDSAPDGRVVALGFDDLDPRTAYDLWRLRQQVFVVEQQCPYPDLDGRDVEAHARADNGRIGVEPPPPEFLGEHHHRRHAGSVIARLR